MARTLDADAERSRHVMAFRCARTASGARRSSCCPIRISASPIWRGSGRALANSTPRSPSSSRSTPNTMSISAARPPTSNPIGATKVSFCRRSRLCGAARAFQRSPPQAANASAADDRPGRPDRRHHAGGADAAGRALRRQHRKPPQAHDGPPSGGSLTSASADRAPRARR